MRQDSKEIDAVRQINQIKYSIPRDTCHNAKLIKNHYYNEMVYTTYILGIFY